MAKRKTQRCPECGGEFVRDDEVWRCTACGVRGWHGELLPSKPGRGRKCAICETYTLHEVIRVNRGGAKIIVQHCTTPKCRATTIRVQGTT